MLAVSNLFEYSCLGLRPLYIFKSFQSGDGEQSLDVRFQRPPDLPIRYSNEAERAN